MASTAAGFETHRALDSSWRELHLRSDDVREKVDGATALLQGLVECARKEREVVGRLAEEVSFLPALWDSVNTLPKAVEDVCRTIHAIEEALTELTVERRRLAHFKACRVDIDAVVAANRDDDARVGETEHALRQKYAKHKADVEARLAKSHANDMARYKATGEVVVRQSSLVPTPGEGEIPPLAGTDDLDEFLKGDN